MMAKPSFDPTPRPPLTTTFASVNEMPPPAAPTCSATRTRRSFSVSSGLNFSTFVSEGAASIGTA